LDEGNQGHMKEETLYNLRTGGGERVQCGGGKYAREDLQGLLYNFLLRS